MLLETIGQRDPVALLVDGENFQTGHVTKLLEATVAFGPVTIRRVFGKSEQIRHWDDQGFRLCPTRPGKNSAVMLLCVQAMRLALRDGFKTIVVASSDRDFTYLAEELRELGVTVIGVGGPTAAQSFRNTCARFVVVENAWIKSPALAAQALGSAAKFADAVQVSKTVATPTESKDVPTPAATFSDPAETKVKKLPLCALDQKLHDLLRPNSKGLLLQTLGSQMKGGTAKAQTAKATWRAYLLSKPQLYCLTGPSTATLVTLKSP